MDIKTEIFRGDTPTFVFTLTEDGLPLDLTNVDEIRFMAKKNISDLDAAAIFNVLCTVDAPATAGICRKTLTAAETAAAGTFIAEVQSKFPGSVIKTADQFVLVITPDVILA